LKEAFGQKLYSIFLEMLYKKENIIFDKTFPSKNLFKLMITKGLLEILEKLG
jgi:hypothetical protein